MKTLLLLFLAGFSSATLADSPIWQISKGDSHVYVGGTMHMLTQQDFPLPPVFDKAYNDASILVFETDMGKLQLPEFQQLSMQMFTYQDGTTLKDVLQPDTLKAVEQHLQARGMGLDTVMQFKPSFLGLMLTIMEFQIMGLDNAGVDQYFYQRSTDDNKAHLYFETPRQQLEFMASLGQGEEDRYVLYSLEEIANVKEQLISMRNYWRRGHFSAMNTEYLIPMKDEFPTVYQSLILNRNNSWLPQITAMLDTPETEMILVGALHLAGNDGVLEQLEEKGFEVKELH